jgi:hypothetical protein
MANHIDMLLLCSDEGADEWDLRELRFEGPQTRLGIAQAFAKGPLRERQAEKRVPTREATRTTESTLSPHARIEIVPWNEVHELSAHEIPRVHASSSTIGDESSGVDSDDPS